MPGLVSKEAREARSAAGIFAALRLLDAGRLHLGGRDQLPPGVPALSAPGRPAPLRDGDRGGLRREEDRARRRALRHPAHRVPRPARRAGRAHALPPAQVQAGGAAEAPRPAPAAGSRPRPKPAVTHDNRFFWEGVAQRELRIQRCNACGRLQHPPGPMCPACHGLDLGYAALAGTRDPSTASSSRIIRRFRPSRCPNLIVLVELEEGTRIVSNLVGARARAGARSACRSRSSSPRSSRGALLPRFRPAAGVGASAWISPSAASRKPCAISRARSSPSAAATSAARSSSAAASGSTRSCGRELVKANLAGLAIPEDVGGSGFGMLEVCARARGGRAAISRRCRWFASLVLGGLPIARFGSDGAAPSAGCVPAAGEGLVLTAALVETGSADPARAARHARAATAGPGGSTA